MVITTTQCDRHRHPEFALEADENVVPPSYLRGVADTIEQMVAGGSVFKPDQTFQVGWMLTLVRRRGESSLLTLVEPDMQTMPMRWVDGITHTLRQMMLQLFMLDSVALRDQMNIPTVRQSLIACAHYADADFFMDRSEPSDKADTGWFVGCRRASHDHNDPNNLQRISLYEVYLNQRGIQGFVSFPIGSQISISRETGVEIGRDGKALSIVDGSFLDAFLKKGVKGLPPDAV